MKLPRAGSYLFESRGDVFQAINQHVDDLVLALQKAVGDQDGSV